MKMRRAVLRSYNSGLNEGAEGPTIVRVGAFLLQTDGDHVQEQGEASGADMGRVAAREVGIKKQYRKIINTTASGPSEIV